LNPLLTQMLINPTKVHSLKLVRSPLFLYSMPTRSAIRGYYHVLTSTSHGCPMTFGIEHLTTQTLKKQLMLGLIGEHK
jgi:hypothetical protein